MRSLSFIKLNELPVLKKNQGVVCLLKADVVLSCDYLSCFEKNRAKLMPAWREEEFRRGRLVLRNVLANCLRKDSCDLLLDNVPDKKISLLDDLKIAISLSHFQGDVLVGLAPIASIGVDLVKVRSINESKLAQRILTADEHEVWVNLNSCRLERLFVYWALKEAMIKCVGGNGWQMKSWQVTFGNGCCEGYNQNLSATCCAKYVVLSGGVIVAWAWLEASDCSWLGFQIIN